MKFWDVIKEMSAQPVRQEASRLFVLALAGNPEHVEAAREAALALQEKPQLAGDAAPFLFTASPPYSDEAEKKLRHADLLVSLPGGPGLTDFRPADTIQVDRVEDLQRMVLDRRPDLRVALGRRLPGFRAFAAEQVIRDVSRVNAEFAAISGVSATIPVLAPLFPAVAGADILVLTKNQILLVFRLAAIHGEDLRLKARAREVMAVIGSAFGWRTVARQLIGLVPGGLGLPIRAAIAYSATYAVGRAAEMVFEQGRRPTRREMLRIYEEARQLAADAAARLKDRFTRDKGETEADPKALPQPEEEPGEIVNHGDTETQRKHGEEAKEP
jgi:uncharacterized protein (DUF697 family)